MAENEKLGFFARLRDDFELYQYLQQAGIVKTMELSRCETYDEFLEMAEANFNLVLDGEAGYAAESIHKRLGIPWIEIRRFYSPKRNHRQYMALGEVLKAEIDDLAEMQKAENALGEFAGRHPGLRVAVGECMNGNPLELALTLCEKGMTVTEVYRALTEDDMPYLRRLGALSPETRIYCNQEPTMLYYDSAQFPADLTIGKDAAYYQVDAAHVLWNEDIQPYGYAGATALVAEMERKLEGRTR